MKKYTNNSDVPLSLAVWLVADGYDQSVLADPNVFSATELIKPVRQIILARRVREMPLDEIPPEDLMSLFNSRLGHAVHDSLEKAWTDADLSIRLQMVGVRPQSADKIVVNPESLDDLKPGEYPVFTEKRRSKKLGKWTISGEFDFNFNYQLEDLKVTQTYAYTMGVNDHHYKLQGSIYRWIFPDLIKQNTTRISFIFKDWKASMAGQAGYPPNPIVGKKYDLMSYAKTEMWLNEKISLIEENLDKPEKQLPRCTDEELWKDPDLYKYYKNPNKTDGRSTKNFNSLEEAQLRLAQDGNVGTIVTVPGKVKACRYCSGFSKCTQKDEYLLDGSLT